MNIVGLPFYFASFTFCLTVALPMFLTTIFCPPKSVLSDTTTEISPSAFCKHSKTFKSHDVKVLKKFEADQCAILGLLRFKLRFRCLVELGILVCLFSNLRQRLSSQWETMQCRRRKLSGTPHKGQAMRQW